MKTHPWILPPFTLDHQLWIGEFEFEYKIEKAAARVGTCVELIFFISKQWIICLIAMSPLTSACALRNIIMFSLRGSGDSGSIPAFVIFRFQQPRRWEIKFTFSRLQMILHISGIF